MIRGETFTRDGALIVHAERIEGKEDEQHSELRRRSFARSVQPPAGAREARHHRRLREEHPDHEGPSAEVEKQEWKITITTARSQQ
ncbi:hypothetical protein [Streptomyces sp. NPDC002573]|uniref:hypothetical protein n=1 Tax=Streptomyces sp. NPDC002573 TaxID=3364651 RepID=UPI0036A42389